MKQIGSSCSPNRAWLYTYRNLYITLFFCLFLFFCIFCFFFFVFWRYGPNEKIYKIKIKNYLNLPSLRSYHIMKKKWKLCTKKKKEKKKNEGMFNVQLLYTSQPTGSKKNILKTMKGIVKNCHVEAEPQQTWRSWWGSSSADGCQGAASPLTESAVFFLLIA